MKRGALLKYALAAALIGASTIAGMVRTDFETARQQPQSESPQFSSPAAQSPALIRVSSNLVTVPVSVTDSSGRPVDNLEAPDFRIEEDNRLEEIAKMAEPGQSPLDLAVLFDVSGSVSPRFTFEQEAAEAFLKKVFRPEDSVLVLAVGAEPQVVQPVTKDLPLALRALSGLQPTRSMTAFFDSVVEAALALRKTAAPDARRVEVVVSDGEDNNSQQYRLPDALREIQRADCIFYAINPAGPSISLNKISLRGQEDMRQLAAETGGSVFLPGELSDLDGIFSRITSELRAQYLLEYYSSNTRTDGTFRRIVVTIPTRPDLRIRARQGYYAPMG